MYPLFRKTSETLVSGVLFTHHASKGVKILSNMNKSRIEILKMKAKRTGSRKELIDELSNIVTVSMDSFMEPESNDLFCKTYLIR